MLLRVIAVIVLLSAGLMAAHWYNTSASAPASADGAATVDEAANPVDVQAATVKQMTLRPALDLVGTIVAIPERTAMVSPQLGGWVVSLDAIEGQSVKAGQALVHLDDRTAKTDIARTHAVVEEKQAALKRLKRGYLPQELEVARQDRDKAKATANGLQSELAALDELRKRGELSPVQYETKLKASQSADAALASADAHLKLLEEGTPTELIEEAQAFLDAANADLEHAELTLEWCTITSPIDGMVVQLLAHQGQFFDRAVPLATVIDLSELFVQLRIPSQEFEKVPLGAVVDVELSSAPGQTFQGTVDRIGGQADPLTGNINVFALVKNEGGALRPGLSCQAHVWLPEVPEAVVVPLAAIADHAGTPVVTLIRDGQAFETQVELGTQTHEFAQVLRGVSPGDTVAVAGGYGLPDACPVRIVADLAASSVSEK